MKLIKKIACFIGIASITLPLSAFAFNDLTIVNNTNRDSTTKINGGPCSSTILGTNGVTKAHSTNVVSSNKLALACIMNRSDCKADVYMTNNCTGPVLGKVVISTSTGVKSVNVYDNSYKVSASGFYIQVDGGPAIS